MRHLVWLLPVLLSCSPAPQPPADGGAECQGVPAKTIEQIFTWFDTGAPTGCVTGCHSAGIGGLKFSTAAELWQATNGKSSATGDGPLVTPFSPARSWLFQRLLPSAPSPMPQGGTLLSSAQLAEVEGWICAGAPGPSGAGGGGGTNTLTVSGLSPGSGYVGTPVTISGLGFSAIPSQNTIRFNGTAAVALTASTSALTANVPAGAATGPVTVQVGTKSASSPAAFTVLAGNPVPVIAGLTPCGKVAGAASFSLTVNGANFLPGSTLSLSGQALAITNATATELTATVPASAVAAAPAGNALRVIVTNPPPGGGPSPPAVFGVAGATSTLAGTVQPLFTANCATNGCHTTAAKAGGLELTAAASRASLVGAFSLICAGRPLVAGCDPTRAGSVLIDKLVATPQSPACSGTLMPKGAPLTAAEKQRVVDWVAQGAP